MININDKYSFTYHQPFLEYNTEYKSYKPKPGDALYGIVWEVYEVNQYNTNYDIVLPDASADIMVFYYKNSASCFFVGGVPVKDSMNRLDFMSDVETVFGVRFCMGSISNLFAVDVYESKSEIIEGQYAMKNKDIVSQLIECNNFKDRWMLVKKYLLERLYKDYRFDPVIKNLSEYIIDRHGIVNGKDLESEMCYTKRRLRQIVGEKLGITIKQFCEVTQFQWVYHIYKESNGKIDMADLALMGGYYDQSHMNLRIKKLTGTLPKNIMKIYMDSYYGI